jgi:DNA modification methylase
LAFRTPEGGLMLIDGHLRAETTPEAMIPTLVTDLSPDEANLLLASYDPLAAMAEADSAKLDALLKDVQTGSEALQAMMADLAKDAGLYQTPEIIEDEVPEPPADPVTKPGDLWVMGEHRLLCGDSTKAEDVGRVMNGQMADMIFTDPPYGVAVCGGTHDPRDKKNHGKGPRIENDDLDDSQLGGFIGSALSRCAEGSALSRCAEVMKKGAAIYVCHADTKGRIFREAFESMFLLHCVVIWVKQQFVFGRSDYHWQHEPILYGWQKGAGHQFYGTRNQGTTWMIDRPMRSDKEHPTQKPVALPAKAIENSSKQGDLLFEPFCGGGSTVIAAEQLGRRCFGLELDPAYCDVICQRWSKLTGRSPVRESDGAKFDA